MSRAYSLIRPVSFYKPLVLTRGGCQIRFTDLAETWWKVRFCTDMKIPVYRLDPRIQDTAVSKYNYSIGSISIFIKNRIYRYTCNVKVMGCILDCRAYETVL